MEIDFLTFTFFLIKLKLNLSIKEFSDDEADTLLHNEPNNIDENAGDKEALGIGIDSSVGERAGGAFRVAPFDELINRKRGAPSSVFSDYSPIGGYFLFFQFHSEALLYRNGRGFYF